MKVTFDCKDPVITRYVTKIFGPKFQSALEHATPVGQEVLLRRFRSELRNEARKQQWYDYEVGPQGREVTTDKNGFKKLLIPEVRITE